MKMKRLEAALKGVLNSAKVANKEKRIEHALNTATDNFEDQKITAEENINSCIKELADTSNIQDMITNISEYIGEKEAAEAGIKRIEKIKKYLDEEVEVEEKKD